MPVLTFVTHKPRVPKSDFSGATRLAGTEGTMCVAVTKPWVSGKGLTIGTDVGVRKLAKGNRVTPPATGAIPAVTIGFGPVIPGVNVETGGNISGSTGFNTLCAPCVPEAVSSNTKLTN